MPSAAALEALERRLADQSEERLPPIESWAPQAREDIGLAIGSDGGWTYLGSPIERDRLVRLFATVLMRDDSGQHWLVTPVEKVPVAVADAAFVVVEMERRELGESAELLLRTNVGDVVIAGPDHPLRFTGNPATEGLVPYVGVRRGLEARLNRSVYYELVGLAETHTMDGEPWLGVWSGGEFFAMSPERLILDATSNAT